MLFPHKKMGQGMKHDLPGDRISDYYKFQN